MIYFERSFLLEPIFGKNYKFESVKLGIESDTIENAYKQIEEDLQKFIKLERQSQPVKTETLPF